MAANASARGQRAAILGSQLHELTGFLLTVDCGTATCRGERAYAVADLAGMFGRQRIGGDVLHRMRCAAGTESRSAPPGHTTGSASLWSWAALDHTSSGRERTSWPWLPAIGVGIRIRGAGTAVSPRP